MNAWQAKANPTGRLREGYYPESFVWLWDLSLQRHKQEDHKWNSVTKALNRWSTSLWLKPSFLKDLNTKTHLFALIILARTCSLYFFMWLAGDENAGKARNCRVLFRVLARSPGSSSWLESWLGIHVYSCFEKGCRKKCTRQSRKVLWVVCLPCSPKKIKRVAREATDICSRVLLESNKNPFDSYSR